MVIWCPLVSLAHTTWFLMSFDILWCPLAHSTWSSDLLWCLQVGARAGLPIKLLSVPMHVMSAMVRGRGWGECSGESEWMRPVLR